MYVTQNTRQRERQLDREEEVATDRYMYTTQNNREREGESDSQIEKEIVRQSGGGGSY